MVKVFKCKSNVYKNLRLLLLFVIIISSNYKVSRYIIHWMALFLFISIYLFILDTFISTTNWQI